MGAGRFTTGVDLEKVRQAVSFIRGYCTNRTQSPKVRSSDYTPFLSEKERYDRGSPKEETTLVQFLGFRRRPNATPRGSVSALAGSLGAALVEMVINLTMGRRGLKGRGELQKIREEARSCRKL